MGKVDQEPRYVPLEDAKSYFVSHPEYVIPEMPVGNTGILFVDILFSQIVAIDPNTGLVTKIAKRDLPTFFRSLAVPTIKLDPSKEVYGPFSAGQKFDIEKKFQERGGGTKLPPKTGGFGLKR